MSAALEGAIENIPAIGFSLLDNSIEADFSASSEIVRRIIAKALRDRMPDYTCLNVNIPNLAPELIKGMKVCRQARANWEEEFDERKDPNGRVYYWMTGVFKNFDEGEDTDVWALENGYVSIVPVQFDVTAHKTIPFFKSWEQ